MTNSKSYRKNVNDQQKRFPNITNNEFTKPNAESAQHFDLSQRKLRENTEQSLFDDVWGNSYDP